MIDAVKRFLRAGIRRLWILSALLLKYATRPLWVFRFFLRGTFKPRKKLAPESPGWAEIPVFYINLESREDRNKQVRKELDLIGLRNYERFDGIFDSHGILGCALSHSALLARLENVKGPVIICEDDIEFLATQTDFELVLSEFLKDDRLDVLCIANNHLTKPIPISERLAIVDDTQTAACYVVKESGRQLLGESFAKSAEKLEGGGNESLFAPDIYWKKLQRGRLFFAIPMKRIAKQRASYSNIQKDWVDYGL